MTTPVSISLAALAVSYIAWLLSISAPNWTAVKWSIAAVSVSTLAVILSI